MFAVITFGIARVQAREKVKRYRPRKFWRITEAAFLWVVAAVELLVGRIQDCGIYFAFGWRGRLRLAQRLNDLGPLLHNFVMIFLPGSCDPLQHSFESWLTISLLRRKISAANKGLQIRR